MSKITSQRASPHREVFLRVVDHAIGTERAHQVERSGALHARDFCAEYLRELHRECANAAGGADDQNLVAGSDPRLVAQHLQRREAGQRDARRLLERQPLRLRHGDPIRRRCQILGESPSTHAEHRLTDTESRDAAPDRFNGA